MIRNIPKNRVNPVVVNTGLRVVNIGTNPISKILNPEIKQTLKKQSYFQRVHEETILLKKPATLKQRSEKCF